MEEYSNDFGTSTFALIFVGEVTLQETNIKFQKGPYEDHKGTPI